MYPVWASVIVKNEESGRAGQAGVVHGTNPADPDQVAVRFDTDLVVELTPVVDLKRLD